jgi:hypothetical protein
MDKEDLDKEAAYFWQDDLAKFFPKSKGPTYTERRMFEGGYRLAQEEVEKLGSENEGLQDENKRLNTALTGNPTLIGRWMEELSTENRRLREALEEMAKPPYADSDLKSLMEWVNARARAALEGK